MRVLLIDDMRTEDFVLKEHFIKVTHVARSFQSGMERIQEGNWDLIVLDHDLASYDKDGKELTGYDIMKAIENFADHGIWELVPKDIYFITSNPVGRENMLASWRSIRRTRKIMETE